jgi:hypothetical protein
MEKAMNLMNLKNVYLLITLGAIPGIASAFPTKMVVKNGTGAPQFVMAFAQYTPTTATMNDKQTSGYVNDINPGEEIDITSRLFAYIEANAKVTIESLTLQINDHQVSLGNAAEILVIIGQKDGKITITVEPKL